MNGPEDTPQKPDMPSQGRLRTEALIRMGILACDEGVRTAEQKILIRQSEY